jgi:hypothetical protein
MTAPSHMHAEEEASMKNTACNVTAEIDIERLFYPCQDKQDVRVF